MTQCVKGVHMITMNKARTFYTKQGELIWLRPLAATDAPLLVDVFEHMSSDSRYRRFQTPVDNPSESQVWRVAREIAGMPPDKQYGLICFHHVPDEGDVPVGAARYVLVEPGVAEAAMSVRDDMQGQGIGTHLLLLLVEEARARGVKSLIASVQNNNKAMWAVFAKVPYHLERELDGNSSNIILNLTRPRSP